MNKRFTAIMNAIAQCVEYDWEEDFQLKEIKKAYATIQKAMGRELTVDNLKNLSATERYNLGFRTFDQETPNTLIPLYLYHVLPIDLPIESISGKKALTGDENVNTDTRGGCIAYRLLLWDNNVDVFEQQIQNNSDSYTKKIDCIIKQHEEGSYEYTFNNGVEHGFNQGYAKACQEMMAMYKSIKEKGQNND